MKKGFLIIALLISFLMNISADEVKTDVVVVGAGSAGIPAAVQSGRAGARTILIESGFQPGGQATTGGVRFPGLFHAWGKQIIAGIGWEWVTRTVELAGDPLPDFSIPTGQNHWKHQIEINIPIYVAIAEELCNEAKVEIRYFEAPSTVEKSNIDGYNWKLTTAAQGEMRTIFCKQLVDCTGNGSLAHLAGAKRLRESVTQPGTYNYVISHNISRNTPYRKEIEAMYQAAIREGRLKPEDARKGNGIDFLFSTSSSKNYVYGADSSTAQLRTNTNLEGRRAMLRYYRFLKTLPGGESAKIVSMQPEVGVRETWRIQGEYLISVDDYVSGRRWDDSLAFAFYPVDIHENATGVHPKHLQEGIVPTIPLRALLVKDIKNLQVAGRCISSDRLANSALRVQASCMASGQAAGASAALAALENTSPDLLDINRIKNLLKKCGAIVP